MRKLPTIAAILALLIMPGMAAAQQSPSQAQAAGKALGAASLQSGRLTPAESNRASQGTGSSNVWGGAYTGSPDSKLTAKQSETSMIGIGNKAINESVSSFQGYNTSRDDQASQATYFLNKNPVLKPTVSSDETWVKPPHGGIGEPVFASDSDKDCKQVDVRTPLDPNETYSCLETYKPYVVPCDNDTNASFVSVPKPNIPAGIGSYYCPAGASLSGTSCLASVTTQYPAVSSYSCPGGGILSGTSCINNSSYAAIPTYSCQDGTSPVNGMCGSSSSYTATAQASCDAAVVVLTGGLAYPKDFGLIINDKGNPVCRWGAVRLELSCQYLAKHSNLELIGYFPNRIGYGHPDAIECHYKPLTQNLCPNGGILSGQSCQVNTQTPGIFNGYQCPYGGSLSGQTCVISNTSEATHTYTCPNGGTLSGSACYVTTPTATPATPNYYCPSGYIVSGNMCTGAVMDQINTSQLNGCGALEGLAQ